MSNPQEQLETTSRFAEESEKRADRMRTVIEHLKSHGLPVDTAERQMSQFHAMARAYRERRDQLQSQLVAKREKADQA